MEGDLQLGQLGIWGHEVIGDSLEEENAKYFWNYVELKRTESTGIRTLSDGNRVISSNSGKCTQQLLQVSVHC